MASRQYELLQAISDEFADLNYIDGNFVVKHNVSVDETVVFEHAAAIIRGYLCLPESEQIRIQLLGNGIPVDIVQSVHDGAKMQELLKHFKKS